MNTILKTGVFITAITLLSACLKPEEFPTTPIIKYKDFLIYPPDSIGYLGELIFTFTDGDGDIGLTQSDTVAPLNYNLFTTPYQRINGKFEEIEPVDTSLTFNYRIPDLRPKGKNKSLEGEISLKILDPRTIPLKNDTLQFEFYIKDRSLNKSNTETTPFIITPY